MIKNGRIEYIWERERRNGGVRKAGEDKENKGNKISKIKWVKK